MATYGSAFADLANGFRASRVSLHFAWSDVKARYRRSILGPLWQSLGTLVGIVGLGMIWSELFKVDRREFVPAMAIGLVVWQMIAGVLAEGCGLFVRQAPVLRNLVQPYSIHPINLVLRHLVNFAHSFVVLVLVSAVLGVRPTPATLLFLPGMLILSVNLLWIAFCVGILGARFRDLEYGVTSLLPVLFLVSPVMYRLHYLSLPPMLLLLNPFTYLIEIVRTPLMGHAPPLHYYVVTLAIAVVGWTLSVVLLRRAKLRLPFWI